MPPLLLLTQMTKGLVQHWTFPGDHLYLEDTRQGGPALLVALAQAVGRQLTVHTTWLPRPQQPGQGRESAATRPRPGATPAGVFRS